MASLPQLQAPPVSLSRLASKIKVAKESSSARPPVLLIIPPSVFLLDERVFLSLGILKIAAVLEQAGRRVEVLDLSGIENYLDVVREHVLQSAASHACITITTPQFPAAAGVVAAIRAARPSMRIVAGGPHVTLTCAAVKLEMKAGRRARAHAAQDALTNLFDVIVAGDGELAVFEALEPGSPKIVDGDDNRGPLFMDNAIYDESPWPARHLVDMPSYKYTIEGHKATTAILQLGCPFKCNFSVTGDTFVFTENGFERIAAMAEGRARLEQCVHGGQVHVHKIDRRVATADGSALAAEVVFEGKRRVFEVAADNGLKVRATPEHPFLTLQEGVPVWRELRALKKGDWLVVRAPEQLWPTAYVKLEAPQTFPPIPPGGFKRKPARIPSELTEDVAWLTGFLIGDGCLPMDGRPSVHFCITDDVRDKLHRIIREQFDVPLSDRPARKTKKMNHGWVHSRAVYEFFTQTLGISPARKLRVPEVIRRSPRAVVQAFVDGLWAADGYVTKDQSFLTTVSSELAQEVGLLLLMLGQCPTIRHVVRGSDDGYGDHYRVSVLKNDRIPTEQALYKSSKSGRWLWRTARDRKCFLGVRRRTLRESGLSHPLDRDGWFYVRVKAITEGLVEDIYDLRVPGDHNFVANGIVSHNCGGRNSKALRVTRNRSTANAIAELEMLHREHGYSAFNFFDDELNVNERNFLELLTAIRALQDRLGVAFRLRGFVKAELLNDVQAKAMYAAGFRWILSGFEAAHPRILENIEKRATLEDNERVVHIAKANGLKTKALMSVGHAGESEETILAVRDWLIRMQPEDFDCTVITVYPGTPYYDEALETSPGIWTYTCKKSGDKLHAYDLDFTQSAGYYKGDPLAYKSYVYTDYLSADRIVELRNVVEADARRELKIPFNASAPAVRYEHSMGAAPGLPPFILRSTAR